MQQLLVSVVLSLLLLVQPSTTGLAAQLWDAGAPGEEMFTFALTSGVLSPQTEYSDEQASTFESGTAFGLSGTYWPVRHVGVRTHVTRSETEGVGASAIEVNDPVQYVWGLEAVARYPMVAGSLAWFPYVSVGPGAKSYRWAAYQPARGGRKRDTELAWTYGGGVEVRFGASRLFGLVADFRQASSDFVWFGFDESQSDFLFTAGVTLNY